MIYFLEFSVNVCAQNYAFFYVSSHGLDHSACLGSELVMMKKPFDHVDVFSHSQSRSLSVGFLVDRVGLGQVSLPTA
jgi:hypothetical protein